MCGIAGKYHFQTQKPVDPLLLKTMGGCLSHRGPDDEGTFLDDQAGVGFVHRRLSIIDLTTGHQPMSDDQGELQIVFNGEIYNFHDLRNELEGKGHRFRTKSDTEVILALYREHGEQGFERLNGIFAFAIFDKRSGGVILARDHFGVKPLYYSLQNGELIFASEIRGVLQDQNIQRELDYEALNSFLTFRYNPSPQTLFKGIRKLPPGHFLKLLPGREPELKSYWNYTPRTLNTIQETEAVIEYQRLLEQAVQRQMLSDVDVGLLLSGGIDSAVIGVLMAQHAPGKIETFTIGFKGEGDFNELNDAKTTSNFIDSEHHEIVLGRKDYLQTFFRSFIHVEEPAAETTIPALYHVAGLASMHLKVVLAGQGADEPLAGYKRYLGERWLSGYNPLMRFLPLKTLAHFLRRNERFKRAAYASQFTNEVERFLGIYSLFTRAQKSELLNLETRARITDVDTSIVNRLYDETVGLTDSINKILYIDTRLSLSDDLLLFGDKVTMAHSLEMRVPFLDIDLVKFLESLPSNLKLRGTTGKYIHKEALKKWLPPEIITRKKRGFSTPMDRWLQTDLADFALKALTMPRSASRRYFNTLAIEKMINAHRSRRENYQRQIFALLSFELWHKTFFEGEPAEEFEKYLL